jgi:hypothetical protein
MYKKVTQWCIIEPQLFNRQQLKDHLKVVGLLTIVLKDYHFRTLYICDWGRQRQFVQKFGIPRWRTAALTESIIWHQNTTDKCRQKYRRSAPFASFPGSSKTKELWSSELTMGHGSNGSPKADGSYGSWVRGCWPMTHQYFLLLCNLRNVTLYNKSVVFCINFKFY